MDTAMELIWFILGYLLGVDFSAGFTPEVTWATLHGVLGAFGAAVTAAGFLYPCFTTMVDIQREQAVGNRTPLPYIASVVNCGLWVLYGYSDKGNVLIVLTNLLGLGSQAYCMIKFLYYCEDHERQGWLIYVLSGLFSGLAIVFFYMSDRKRYMEVFCWACALCRCLPPLAPLLRLDLVFRQKSMRSMPSLPVCCIALASGILWAGFGCTGQVLDGSGLQIVFLPSLFATASAFPPQIDGFIFLPSLFATTSALIQLVLHAIYGQGEEEDADPQ